MAIPAIFAALGSKVGMNVIGKIMEKTLPSATKFLKASIKAPFDVFEKVMDVFGGKPSKTPPANQFFLITPARANQVLQAKGGFAGKIRGLSYKLKQISKLLSQVANAIDTLKQVLGGKAGPIQAKPGQISAKPMGTDELLQEVRGGGEFSATGGAPAGEPGISDSSSKVGGGSGLLKDQWALFNTMQRYQKAAQMFEMMVKISELKHQAAMSAIRGIRY